MGPFEYQLLFAAVVLGLAVSDLANSVHRLVVAGKRVRWDWLAPLAAFVAFLKIVIRWWTWRAVEPLAGRLTFEMFAAFIVSTVLLFLLAASSLPDEVGRDETLDLRAFWESGARRYWALFLAQWLLSNAVAIWAQMELTGARFTLWAWPYLMGPVLVSLLIVRNRWWHALCLVGMTAFYLSHSYGRTLPV